jgi:hypothetical protein
MRRCARMMGVKLECRHRDERYGFNRLKDEFSEARGGGNFTLAASLNQEIWLNKLLKLLQTVSELSILIWCE